MQFLSWFLAGLSWMDTETVALVGIKPNVAIHFSLVLDAISKLVFGWLELDGHVTVVAEAVSVVATVGTVSKTMVATAVVSVVGISLGLGLSNSGGLGVSGPLAVVSVVSVGVGVVVSVVGIGISLGLGISQSEGNKASRNEQLHHGCS